MLFGYMGPVGLVVAMRHTLTVAMGFAVGVARTLWGGGGVCCVCVECCFSPAYYVPSSSNTP